MLDRPVHRLLADVMYLESRHLHLRSWGSLGGPATHLITQLTGIL